MVWMPFRGKLDRLKEVESEIVQGVTPEYIDRRIEKLLDYAKENSPYYRKYKGTKCLQDFPVLNKGDYLEHYEEIPCEGYRDKGKIYSLSTSGSTGTPFTVICDGDKMNRVNMNFISCMELNGFRMGMKKGGVPGMDPGKNTISRWKSFKNNLLMIDISNMGDDARPYLQADPERKDTGCGSPSALTALSSDISRNQIEVKDWSVEMIFAMGEALPWDTYHLLTEEFGFSPVRSYGNNENGFIAIQLGEEKGYTIRFLLIIFM